MAVISMKQLLEAGVHFGHQTRRWNPKMAEYIFTERNGIYIIDLQKTVKKIDEAYYFIREVISNGDEILFVGTKKQAQDAIKEEAVRCGQYYVNSRWLGGMLTNFKTIRQRIARLNELSKMEEDGVFNVLPKKEVIQLKKEMEKLEKSLGGIRDMRKTPGVIFIVDPKKERNAILEARRLKIPIVAIVDTNCDPDEVDYVIPGNDDAIRAVKLIVEKIADAVIEARQGESFAEAVEESVPGIYSANDADVITEVVDSKVNEAVAAPAAAAEPEVEVVEPVAEQPAGPVEEPVVEVVAAPEAEVAPEATIAPEAAAEAVEAPAKAEDTAVEAAEEIAPQTEAKPKRTRAKKVKEPEAAAE